VKGYRIPKYAVRARPNMKGPFPDWCPLLLTVGEMKNLLNMERRMQAYAKATVQGSTINDEIMVKFVRNMIAMEEKT